MSCSLTAGDPMFSRRCADRVEAELVILTLHQNALRAPGA
jgi:hypothetical protein